MFHTPFAVIREDEVRFLSANRGCHQAALFWHMSPPSLLAGDILGITHIGLLEGEAIEDDQLVSKRYVSLPYGKGQIQDRSLV